MSNQIKGMRLFVTVVDRGMGNKVVKLFEDNGCFYHNIVYGKGTAPKEIYEYLGFDHIEKEVVFSIVDEEVTPQLILDFKTKLNFGLPGNGVACTIPLDSVAGQSVIDEIMLKQVGGKM